MGYLWTRKAVAKTEHIFDAIGFGHQATAYVNKKHPDLNVKVYVQTMGETNAICWTANFDSVDTFHAHFASLMQDQEYASMLKQAGKFFVDGRGQDSLMMELPGA